MAKYCVHCGAKLNEQQDVCLGCGIAINKNKEEDNSYNPEAKSKVSAGVLGIFLGALGVHNFYLEYISKGVAQLLITILSFGILSPISAIWGLIEGIMILTGSIDKDANGVKLRN